MYVHFYFSDWALSVGYENSTPQLPGPVVTEVSFATLEKYSSKP